MRKGRNAVCPTLKFWLKPIWYSPSGERGPTMDLRGPIWYPFWLKVLVFFVIIEEALCECAR